MNQQQVFILKCLDQLISSYLPLFGPFLVIIKELNFCKSNLVIFKYAIYAWKLNQLKLGYAIECYGAKSIRSHLSDWLELTTLV